MMPPTGLQFYRKKQTVDNFQNERPKSLPDLYEAVENEVQEIEKRLEMLETSFYGLDKSPDNFVKIYLPVLKESMDYCKMSFFKSYHQMEELFWTYEKSLGDPTMEVDFSKDNVAMVTMIIDKVMYTLRSGFGPITEKIDQLVDNMKKYCLSFMSTDGDPYLETATNYERQRRELAEAISINLQDIPKMADRFHDTGMDVEEMGSVPRNIAARCQSDNVPILVMFPAACENVRNACRGIRKWIQADKGYSVFIQNDIRFLEEKVNGVKKELRSIQSKYFHLEHRIKMVQREIEECIEDIKRTASKENIFLEEDQNVLRALHEIDSEIDIRKTSIKELKKKNGTENKDQMENAQQELMAYQMKREVQEKKKEEIQRKLDVLNDRKMVLKEKEDILIQTKQDKKEVRKILRRHELDLERLNYNLKKLREIFKYKINAEVLKKLFFNQSITTKATVAMKKRRGDIIADKLDKAMRLVAENVDGDWGRLYWSLPFYPSRGQANIQHDIDEIKKEFMREASEGLAKQALQRWRRLHTRANVDDLRETLVKIRRKDIVRLMDSEILVKKTPSPDIRHIPLTPARNVRFPRVTSSRKTSLTVR